MNLSDYYPSLISGTFKNKIINGAMDIWQRGTTFSGVSAFNTFSADRFFWGQSLAGGVVTLSRETNVPNQNFNYSLRATVTTADAAIVAGDSYLLAQRIEGFNIVDLIGNTFTLSFWVRSPKTGTHCVSFRSDLATASYVSEYTINSANTWEFKTITVQNGIDTSVGGPWDTTNGLGMAVYFALATGSIRQTATTNAWVAGDFQATAAAVNCMDTIGNIFAITGVQLERGATATEFEYRPIGTELALCQRYYEKSYDIDEFAGEITSRGTWAAPTQNGNINATAISVKYKVSKRAIPTITVYNPSTGASNQMRDSSGINSSVTIFSNGENGFYATNSGTAFSANAVAVMNWITSAEL